MACGEISGALPPKAWGTSMRERIELADAAQGSGERGLSRALAHLAAAIAELRKTHPQFVADVAFVVDELASEGRAGEKPSRQSSRSSANDQRRN
jgi:hypothetical protein